MLRLADQVACDEGGVGTVVGKNGDLGRAGLCVDADDSAQQPFGRHAVDVRRSCHEVDGVAVAVLVPVPIGEHRHSTCTPGGVHLVNSKQCARRQHQRVWQPRVVTLRRARQRQGADSCDLCRYDVHEHR